MTRKNRIFTTVFKFGKKENCANRRKLNKDKNHLLKFLKKNF